MLVPQTPLNMRCICVQVSPPADLDEVMDGESSPESVMATGWSCSAVKGVNKKVPAFPFAETMGDSSAVGHEELAWDCEACFAELYAQGELVDNENVGFEPCDGTTANFVLPESGVLAMPTRPFGPCGVSAACPQALFRTADNPLDVPTSSMA